MATSKLTFIESPYERRAGETFPFRVDVSQWVTGTYSSPAVAIYDDADSDVTGSTLSGSASFSGSILTTPDFVADALTVGETYKIVFSWQVDGKIFEAYGYLEIS